MSALGLDDPVLQDISATKRSATGVDLAATFIDIVANHPTYEWNALLGEKIAAVGPEYRQVFGAITTSCLNLLFPAEIVDPIVRLVANSIMSKEEAAFLADVYSPRFRNKTVDVRARLRYRARTSTVALCLTLMSYLPEYRTFPRLSYLALGIGSRWASRAWARDTSGAPCRPSTR